MEQSAELGSRPDRKWLAGVLVVWLIAAAFFIYTRWSGIHWFALGDTDDNMRIQQVRDWLNGQAWYDLRQHRLDPPRGADIHWSRLVDLPIAALILLFRPLFGNGVAEQIAVAVAPMLPLLITLVSVGLTVRRLVSPQSWPIALGIAMLSQAMLAMYMPLRIDHHGWQLAMLALLVAGLVDSEPRRGGLTVAVATTLSLVIGMEMLPYLALAGAGLGLRWVIDGREAMRLRAYSVMLAGGVGIGYLAFASYANQQPRCDALSPVWLSVMLASGGLAFLLTMLRTERPVVRLVAAALAGGLLAAGYVYFWPQCTGQLEGFSPELKKLWFDNVREVKPLWVQNRATVVTVGFSALFGTLGALYGAWSARGTERFAPWLHIALLAFVSMCLLFWQTRAGPSAQVLSIAGLTAFTWVLVPAVRQRLQNRMLARIVGTVAAFALSSGLAVQGVVSIWTGETKGEKKNVSDKANAQCSTIPSHAAIGKLPKATIFTFADLSPRLIVLTHHSAISGPYHRNEAALLDVHRTFRGSVDAAEAVVRRHGATLVMVCKHSSESTIYKADGPKGFYAQLEANTIPAWLEPVPLPEGNPFTVWRVKDAQPIPLR